MRPAAWLALVLACSGCKHITFDRVPTEVDHRESASAGGVHWRELYMGEGPSAQLGDVVVFDYTIWLLDGTRVDSTLDRGVPLESPLGHVPVEGFNQGLVGMRPGGRRRMTIPPELAYGKKGWLDVIPPDAALDCEVHLVEVRPAAH